MEKSKRKPWWNSNGELAAKYNCPFLKGCLCRCEVSQFWKGDFPWAHPGHVQFGLDAPWLSQKQAWWGSLLRYLKIKISPLFVTLFHVLFSLFLTLWYLEKKENWGFFVFWDFFAFSLTFVVYRMKPLKVTKATEMQANREWCVVKLKQIQSIIDLATRTFKAHNKWTLRMMEPKKYTN